MSPPPPQTSLVPLAKAVNRKKQRRLLCVEFNLCLNGVHAGHHKLPRTLAAWHNGSYLLQQAPFTATLSTAGGRPPLLF